MKRIVLLLSILCCGTTFAETINLQYMNEDNTVYENTTCTIGDDLILPTPPTKRGYTFAGWRAADIQRIEYLESTGTQWIDTGFQFTGVTLTYNLKYKRDGTDSSVALFGVSDPGDRNWCGIPYYPGGTINRLALGNNSGQHYLYETANTFYDYSLTIDRRAMTFTLVINGDTYSNTWSGICSGRTLFLFGSNFTSEYKGSMLSKYKNYGFQIIQDDILVRDFIPVLDPADVPCMYDKVEGKFYYKQGTGQFIAGPVIVGE